MVALRPPIICLVTDRRQLPDPTEDNLVRLTTQAAAAGVTMIQIRERDLDDRALFSLTTRIVAAVRDVDTAVLVNDRADIAVAARASGVHLRSDSVPTDRVRAIAPGGFLIGRSIHSVAEAPAEGVDYLVMGTVFPTSSKPAGTAIAGTEAVRAVCRRSTAPVLAIGGISADNTAKIAQSGAAGIAAITLFTSLFKDRTDHELRAVLEQVVAKVRAAWIT